MVYQPKDPVGYKKLLTWKQAGEIYRKSKDFSRNYLSETKDRRLIPHIVDSARSVQRNIEEGYKRATTAEYVKFLGFSRGSLEELKGDFEELKREWKEGLRWGKGIRENKGDIGEIEIREDKGLIRERVIKEIEGLLDLIYGEDCMMGRQIVSLEKKMVAEKTLPQGEMIRRSWKKRESAAERFRRIERQQFGIVHDERGVARKIDKGKEGIEKGKEGIEKGKEGEKE